MDSNDLQEMFCNCCSLISLNLSNFNTNNVIDMSWMFRGCKSLTNINLSNFNTNKVTLLILVKCSLIVFL